MKKLSLVMTLVLILGCMVFVSGCGSDKFEGKWVGVRETALLGNKGASIIELEIKKNGDNYIVNTKTEDLDIHFSDWDKKITAIHFNKRTDEANLGASAKDNVLRVTSGNAWTFTYDKSTKHLHGILDYATDNVVEFVRDDDGKLFEKTKNEEFAKLKDEAQEKQPNYTLEETEGK